MASHFFLNGEILSSHDDDDDDDHHNVQTRNYCQIDDDIVDIDHLDDEEEHF